MSHVHQFVPTPAGRQGGKIYYRNHCACGAPQSAAPDPVSPVVTPRVVETHAALYDLLHDYFGIGGHDDVLAERNDDVPWYKARMNEIGKLKRLMTSRHVTLETMVQVATYAHDQHLPITATWQLIEAIPDARRAAQADARRPLSDRLSEAVSEALAAGEDLWASRLAKSTSVDALHAWEAHRG
jgi:hypothetical protein